MAAAVNIPPVPETVPVDSLGIPRALRSLDQWVTWVWDYQPTRSKPFTKVPYNPKTNRKAKANTRSTWTTCAAALAAYDENRYPGIGFVLSPDDPFGFIDLDRCRNPKTFEVEVWAQSIIDLFRDNAYIELSPSGTGIKIIGRFTWPSDRGHVFHLHGGQIEVYTHDKYTTVTGAVLSVSQEEPGYIQDAIDQVAELYFPIKQEDEPITRIYDRTPLDMDDDALIDLIRASKQGQKFDRLYFDGSTSDHDGDESRADAALVAILAFYTRNDATRIDRIFRTSARMRPKWDDKRRDSTYGWNTINNIVKRVTDVYEPRNADQRPQPPRGKQSNGEPVDVADVWPDPIDLEPVEDAPSLSSHLLPKPLANWILDAAERVSIFPEMIAAPAIVAASSVIGRAIGIRPAEYDDYVAIPNLWGGLIQPPGSMKSSAIDEGMRFIKRLAATATEQYRESVDAAEAKVMVIDEKITDVRRRIKAALKVEDDIESLQQQLIDLRREKDLAKPKERRYLTHDATVEKIAELLINNPRGLLVLRDELHGLLRSFDKSGREEDRAFYLEGWNGNGTFSSDRIGRGTIHVDNFALSIFGSIQPGRIKGLISESTSDGEGNDGLLQRFQILIWPGKLPPWSKPVGFRDSRFSDEVFKVFQFLDRLDPFGLGASRTDGRIPYLPFSPNAQIMADRFRQGLEDRLRGTAFDGMPAYASHISKYRSLMPSLALIFHLMDIAAGASDKTPVTEAPTQLAIDWCEYLESHVRKVYEVEVDQGKQAARLLIAKIEDGSIVDGQSVREIYRPQWSGLRTDEIVMQGIAVLVDHNIVRTESGATGGRPTQIIRINPAMEVK